MSRQHVSFVGEGTSDDPTGGDHHQVRSAPARWADRVVPVAAAVAFVAAMVVASLCSDATVDSVSTSYEHALDKVDDVASHPTQVRVAFLAVIVLLLCIGPIVRPLRNLTTARGALVGEVGYRCMCIGSCFAAVGNAYAPLVVGSTAGIDREAMARFVLANETSWVSYGILGVYALLPIGAILLTIGLLRARAVPRWQAVVIGAAFVTIMPIPVGPATLVLAAVFAVMLTIVLPPAVREVERSPGDRGRTVTASAG